MATPAKQRPLKRCFICGAGPRGLRSYSSNNLSGKRVVTEWICAEWLVPCHRRNNAYGKKVRERFPPGQRKRLDPVQASHRERARLRREERRWNPKKPWWHRLRETWTPKTPH